MPDELYLNSILGFGYSSLFAMTTQKTRTPAFAEVPFIVVPVSSVPHASALPPHQAYDPH